MEAPLARRDAPGRRSTRGLVRISLARLCQRFGSKTTPSVEREHSQQVAKRPHRDAAFRYEDEKAIRWILQGGFEECQLCAHERKVAPLRRNMFPDLSPPQPVVPACGHGPAAFLCVAINSNSRFVARPIFLPLVRMKVLAAG